MKKRNATLISLALGVALMSSACTTGGGFEEHVPQTVDTVRSMIDTAQAFSDLMSSFRRR